MQQRQILRPSILGLDVGGTKTACVEGSADARILARTEWPTQAERPFDEVFPQVVEHIRTAIDNAHCAGRNPVALSVSIGGPLRIEEGFLINPPHLPGWHNLPLKAWLMEAFPSLPVYVEHDGNAGALAEFHFGVGKNRPHLRHSSFSPSEPVSAQDSSSTGKSCVVPATRPAKWATGASPTMVRSASASAARGNRSPPAPD